MVTPLHLTELNCSPEPIHLLGKRHRIEYDFALTPKLSIKKRRLRKKSVRFLHKVETFERPSLTKDDTIRAWFQPQDYRNFSNDALSTIQAIQLSSCDLSSLDVEKLCIRGLERQVSALVFGPPMNTIKSIIQQVLVIHQQQKIMATKDPQFLKMFYTMLSRQHRCEALQQAAIDAFE